MEVLVLNKEYAAKDATELEGEVTSEQSGSAEFHYDSSVEVSGNDRDDGDYDCDCDNNCDCTECASCDDCGDSVDECRCDGCLECSDCNCDMDDCACYDKKVTDGCSDCDDASSKHLEKIACSGCKEDNFRDNAVANCLEQGNYHSNCQYECGCEIEHSCRATRSDGDGVDGEMVSPPLQTKALSQWIRDNYPVRTNTTCGAHRHRSFKKIKYYSILMDRQFHEYLIRRLRAWGKSVGVREGSALFRRLNGDVHWCKDMYDGYNQISTSDKEDCRYRIINYCWKLHGTLEIRVLPAFQDVELTVSAHKELGDIMDDYITRNINTLEQRRTKLDIPIAE